MSLFEMMNEVEAINVIAGNHFNSQWRISTANKDHKDLFGAPIKKEKSIGQMTKVG